jgi:hypothetical protein
MCRRHNLRAGLFRGAEFRKTEARYVCMDVYDVRGRPAQPFVKEFRAANDHASLRLVTRDPRRYRVSIHLESIQLVGPLRLAGRFRRRDQDFVPRGAQSFRQLRYVNLCAAIRRWKVPTGGLNNAQ